MDRLENRLVVGRRWNNTAFRLNWQIERSSQIAIFKPIHVFSSDSLPVFELPPGFSANRTELHFLGNFRLPVDPAADSIAN
jgi:hypothetical protein